VNISTGSSVSKQARWIFFGGGGGENQNAQRTIEATMGKVREMIFLGTFSLRDAMRKRGHCCRRVSVRPSVCHVGALFPHG